MNCKSLRLTQWGIQKLTSTFSKEAIEWADGHLVRNPSNSAAPLFNQLWGLCTDYCRTNKIRPDWDAANTFVLPKGEALEEKKTAKKGTMDFRRAPLTTSQPTQGGTPPSSTSRPVVTFAGRLCYLLSEEDAQARRNEWIANPEIVAGVDKLALLMGHKSAYAYFQQALTNLKYLEIETNSGYGARSTSGRHDAPIGS